MGDMDKDRRINIRISERERAKLEECAAVMGCSKGEFLRRCMQVMMMVMGDEESKKAIHRILDEATSTIKMGAGLATRTPQPVGVTSTPLLPKGRKGKAGR